MNKSTVSMDTIAQTLGISKVTVSKALNEKEGVSQELRIKIKEKAQELGYHVNIMAKGLRSNQTFNIGILIAERYLGSEDNYYFEVYGKFVRKFNEYNYNSIMEIIDSDKENNLILPDLFVQRKVDSIIIIGECHSNYLKLFEKSDIPIMFFDFCDEDVDIDSITVDNYVMGTEITKLLLNKGYKEIGFVGNIYSTSSIKDRFLGYYKALLDNKSKLNYDYVISDRDDEGNLIDIKLPDKLPNAFVCNNDQVAFHIINKLIERGIKVPEDVAVVAFDNTIYSRIARVPITTVDTNVDTLVEKASKAIIKKMNKPEKVYDKILVKGNIIERDSVK